MSLLQRTEPIGVRPDFIIFCFIFTLSAVVFLGFCTNVASAKAVKASDKYQEIKEISKELKRQKDSDNFEELVEKSKAFIKEHPKYKKVDEVYYILGNALVQHKRTEEGIALFEELINSYPVASYAEVSLLELGLAYDKLGEHDKADDVYKKLVNHPKFGSRTHAKKATQLLARKRSLRNGQLNVTPENPFIGKLAKAFEVIGMNGEKLSLKKYRGQVVLLDFWGTWCAPCIAEKLYTKETYKKYKEQDFEIIGISVDRDVQPVEAYIENEGITWQNFWDGERTIAGLYNVYSIPSTFLIDGDGIIRETNLRGQALETAVAELVKENLAKKAEKEVSVDSQAPQIQ